MRSIVRESNIDGDIYGDIEMLTVNFSNMDCYRMILVYSNIGIMEVESY